MTGIANATEAEAERETDIEITPEMTRAGAAVIAELGGECDFSSWPTRFIKPWLL